MKNEYLSWMAANTPSQWCNDSAMFTEIEHAFKDGAVGVTWIPAFAGIHKCNLTLSK